MSWLQALRSQVDEEGWRRLQAFPGTPLRTHPPAHLPPLGAGEALRSEVDADQAALFQRRLEGSSQILADIADNPNARHPRAATQARAYRMALHLRAEEILAAPAPRARRLRALADYYASCGALLLHADPTLPKPWELGVRWSDLAGGARLGKVTGASSLGPVHLHLLELPDPAFHTRICAGQSLEALAQESGALAASSGGFFLYSEADIAPPAQRGDPVGWLVSGGQTQRLPLLGRGALFQDEPVRLGRVDLVGTTLTQGDWAATVGGHNDPTHLGREPVLFNRAWGPNCVDHWGPSVVLWADRVLAVGKGAMAVPLDGAVLCLPPGHPLPNLGGIETDHPAQEAMAGGPMLLRNGQLCIDRPSEDFLGSAPPVTFSQDETFDQNLLPRLAVGLRADGSLVLACIDGRNLERGVGLTLDGTARLLKAQGCVRALNLDGGSSKRLWVRGHGGVDLADTELRSKGGQSGRIREVRTALLWNPQK